MTAELIEARARTWVTRRRIAVLPEVQDLVLELIFRTIGVRIDERPLWRRHYEDLLLDAIPIRTRLPGSPAWRAARARAWLDRCVGALIGEVRRAKGAEGLAAELARARDEDGAALSEQHLVDNILFLVLAGHETTASVMAWLVLELAARPALWSELLGEATAAPAMPTSPEELGRFPYAEALFREAVRMYPPVPVISRVVTGSLLLSGRQIPEGVLVSACVGHLSRDGRRYPDPDRFDPTRWLRRSEPATPAEMVQFGAGPHFCLGYHLAWMEVVQLAVALARVMAAADLRPRLDARTLPSPLYLPLCHPPAKTQIVFDRA
jgi:cytochrome P450